MKVSFDLTADDWLEFQRHYSSTSKQFQSTKKALFRIPLLVMAMFLLFFYSRGELTPFGLILFFAASILWVLFFSRILEKFSLMSAKKMLNEGSNSKLFGKYEIDFTSIKMLTMWPYLESSFHNTA